VTPAFESLQKQLKQLPGIGFRSAERIALHLLVEKPDRLPELVGALDNARARPAHGAHRFDRAIRGGGFGDKAGGQLVDALVVQ
jgi:Holliday junction resolvasome RuvABC DNA-binding subunit